MALVAAKPRSAVHNMGMSGAIATNAMERRVLVTSSAPGAQSGRSSVTPLRICSVSCACASTPGVEGLMGVATMSDKSEALAPMKTIFQARSERSAPGLRTFQAGIERRWAELANHTRRSPAGLGGRDIAPTL